MFGRRRAAEVDLADEVVGEEDLPLPVGLRAWPQADGQFGKGATDIPTLAFEDKIAGSWDDFD